MKRNGTEKMTRKRFIVFSAVISALVIAAPFLCSEQLTETFRTVYSGKITGPVKLAFLSDVHNSIYGSGMSELIDSVDRFAPDAVLFGGDLFDRCADENNSLTLARELARKYPCFYALGNHEFQGGDSFAIRRAAAKAGLNVLGLENNAAELTVNGCRIVLTGVDSADRAEQLARAAAAVSDSVFTVLLDHYPEEFPVVAGKGFDLVLAGHAHGGQWRLPPLINGLYAPGQGLFPEYTDGEYTIGSSRMIVSRGLCRLPRDILFPRILNRPEAVYITLMPA